VTDLDAWKSFLRGMGATFEVYEGDDFKNTFENYRWPSSAALALTHAQAIIVFDAAGAYLGSDGDDIQCWEPRGEEWGPSPLKPTLPDLLRKQRTDDELRGVV